MSKKLTFKQTKFVNEYAKDGNASRAVREAYPNITTEGAIRTMGAKLVANGNIQDRILAILDEAGLTPELISKELKELITSQDKAEKNKAIRTAAEIMGLIGRGGIIAAQINMGENKGLFSLLEDFKKDDQKSND